MQEAKDWLVIKKDGKKRRHFSFSPVFTFFGF